LLVVVDPEIDLQQRVDRLVEEVGALVGQRAVVEMNDQQQAYQQRTVDQRFGMLADALATLGLQPQYPGEQVIGALVAAHGVLRVDAGVGLGRDGCA
jgi:nucleoside-diphosphate-sugar epimerase